MRNSDKQLERFLCAGKNRIMMTFMWREKERQRSSLKMQNILCRKWRKSYQTSFLMLLLGVMNPLLLQ